jgi:hypothetical protein
MSIFNGPSYDDELARQVRDRHEPREDPPEQDPDDARDAERERERLDDIFSLTPAAY